MSSEEESDYLSYLTSNTMATISSTLALAANVTAFDCTELWTLDHNGTYYCPYVYATAELQQRCPHLLTGHHPRDKIDHVLSPQLCQYAKSSPKRFHWRGFSTTDRPSPVYKDVTFPVLTEIAYFLENTNGVDIFIVGLATEKLQFKPSTFKFLQGLGYAIYVSAFLMKDNEGADDPTTEASNIELDHKEFVPNSTIITPYISAVNLAAMHGSMDFNVIRKNFSDANLRSSRKERTASFSVPEREREKDSSRSFSVPERDNLRSYSFSFPEEEDANADVGMTLCESSPPTTPSISIGRKSVSIAGELSPLALGGFPSLPEGNENEHEEEGGADGQEEVGEKGAGHQDQDQNQDQEEGQYQDQDDQDTFDEQMMQARFEMQQTRNRAPTWDPTYPFSFPVAEIPSNTSIPDNLTTNDFTKILHVADGSNSNIYTAMFCGTKVVIKMIKEGMGTDPIALHEFDLEYGMLSRIQHPHVITILGAGYEPRRFMVLEHLAGGSLHSVLAQNEAKGGFATMLFRKPTFTYIQLLQRARDMAEALDYLHFRCHPGATIIHRDLKPDNVGFTADGTLKLFDFGLVTCVRTRDHPTDAYTMTGYTGSLRYMAPEVALREPYSEKVDVYSFGIMLWQMARDNLPFTGLGKTAFMQEVVRGNSRPKLDRSWPDGFNNLLTACWARDPVKRPSFSAVLLELNTLMGQISNENKNSAAALKGRIIKGITKDKINSSWF